MKISVSILSAFALLLTSFGLTAPAHANDELIRGLFGIGGAIILDQMQRNQRQQQGGRDIRPRNAPRGGSRQSVQSNPARAAEPRISRDNIFIVQARLNQLGFNAGDTDGSLGRQTRNAIRQFQSSIGASPTGYLNRSQLALLLEGGGGALEAARSNPDMLTPSEMTEFQRALNAAGYDAGQPDGVSGPRTSRAIAAFLGDRGFDPYRTALRDAYLYATEAAEAKATDDNLPGFRELAKEPADTNMPPSVAGDRTMRQSATGVSPEDTQEAVRLTSIVREDNREETSVLDGYWTGAGKDGQIQISADMSVGFSYGIVRFVYGSRSSSGDIPCNYIFSRNSGEMHRLVLVESIRNLTQRHSHRECPSAASLNLGNILTSGDISFVSENLNFNARMLPNRNTSGYIPDAVIPSGYDLHGLSLDMKPAELTENLKGRERYYYYGFQDSHKDSHTNSELLILKSDPSDVRQACTANRSSGAAPEERIYVTHGAAHSKSLTKPSTIMIERNLSPFPHKRPTLDGVRKSLLQKYGQPTQDVSDRGTFLIWAFDRSGNKYRWVENNYRDEYGGQSTRRSLVSYDNDGNETGNILDSDYYSRGNRICARDKRLTIPTRGGKYSCGDAPKFDPYFADVSEGWYTKMLSDEEGCGFTLTAEINTNSEGHISLDITAINMVAAINSLETIRKSELDGIISPIYIEQIKRKVNNDLDL